MVNNQESKSKPNKRSLVRLIIIVIVIGAAANILISFFLDSDRLIESIRKIRLIAFIIPFLAYLLINVIDSIRVKLVLWQLNYKIPTLQAFFNSVIGIFITNLTPLAAGGQPFQIYHLSSQGVDLKTSTNVILSRFVEQAMLLMAIVLLSIPRIIKITATLNIGSVVIYIALFFTFVFAMLFLLLLIRPNTVGNLAIKLEHSFIGKIVHKFSKKRDWAERLFKWSHELRDEVHFLWTHKTVVMIVDTFLGLVVLLLQASSLFFVFRIILKSDISLFETFITFNIIWQIIFYIPTPGASGSIEGAFALVFSGLTGAPEKTLVSVFVWRFSTYYLHILFGGIIFWIYMKLQTKQDKDHIAIENHSDVPDEADTDRVEDTDDGE